MNLINFNINNIISQFKQFNKKMNQKIKQYHLMKVYHKLLNTIYQFQMNLMIN
jgi:hypothetical protein